MQRDRSSLLSIEREGKDEFLQILTFLAIKNPSVPFFLSFGSIKKIRFRREGGKWKKKEHRGEEEEEEYEMRRRSGEKRDTKRSRLEKEIVGSSYYGGMTIDHGRIDGYELVNVNDGLT